MIWIKLNNEANRSVSPVQGLVLKLIMAAIIVLAEPLSPFLYESVSFMVLEINSVAEFLGIPDHHIVVDLHTLSIEKGPAEPMRQP